MVIQILWVAMETVDNQGEATHLKRL